LQRPSDVSESHCASPLVESHTQRNMIVGRKMEGLVLARMRLLGTSKTTYYGIRSMSVWTLMNLPISRICSIQLTVMKNTTKAMEYWSESMPRSVVMPATLAFPMLVRCAECQLSLRRVSFAGQLTNIHIAQKVHDLSKNQ
jgi:hypothetical protein